MRPYLKNPWEQGREMTQALYAHKNNLKKNPITGKNGDGVSRSENTCLASMRT
jgi:hypothetical protein